jgi:uncharacterized membrane protein YkvA (DUF1232 family)
MEADMADNKNLVLATIVLWWARLVAIIGPGDMIPDFIPLFGVLDDVLGVVAMIAFTGYTGFRVARSAIALGQRTELPPVYEPLTLEELRAL